MESIRNKYFKNLNAVVKEENLVENSNLYSKITNQLGFYFSDFNLERDKFLERKIKADDGWVKISVLLTFKKLAALSKNPAVIAAAVKNDTKSILEVDTTNEKIRRKPDIKPVAGKKLFYEVMERSIYCAGFPKTATMDELLEFAATFGDNVITGVKMRKYKTQEFKGSIFLNFNSKEQAEHFLKHESVKYKNVELERMRQIDFLEKTHKENEYKQALQSDQMKVNTEKYLEMGYLLKVDILKDTVTFEDIKMACFEFGWKVNYVKMNQDRKIAWIRLKPIKTAKDLLEEIAENTYDLDFVFTIPEENIELTVLKIMDVEKERTLFEKAKMLKSLKRKKEKKRLYKLRNEESDYSGA